MYDLSIIIPSYNERGSLINVLESLNKQSYNMKKVELIIIDDGSDKNLKQKLVKFKPVYKLRFKILKKNKGPAVARNEGLKIAKGKYILFMGDDTIANEKFIEEHINLHKKHKGIAVLGWTIWDNKIRNEFMNYAERFQFRYHTIKNQNNATYHFYGSNISLEKIWFNNDKFSEKFKKPGVEDLEIGYRLENKGLRIVYNTKALLYHHHNYTFEQFCKRMKNLGKSVVIFTNLHPELKIKYIPRLIKLYKIGSFILSQNFFIKINKKLYWFFNFVFHYIIGIEEESKNLNKK